MRFSDLLRDTLRTLWSQKRRTALSMFGIAWGVVAITLMAAAGEGLRVGQKRQTEGFGKDVMIVFAGRTGMQAGGERAGRALSWYAGDPEAVAAESPGCRYVLPELSRGGIAVRSAYNSASLIIAGSHPPFQEIRSIPVARGRFYSWEDEAKARRVAFLGSDAAKQLFAGRDPMGQNVNIAGHPYVIVGLMEFKEQDSSYDGRDVSKIFVPFSSMLRDFPIPPPARSGAIDRMLAAPVSIETHEACKGQIARSLARRYNFDPRDEEAARIWDTVEDAKRFESLTTGMQVFLGAVGVVTILLGGLGVMNVMLVAVRERTREIGVRKALGATRRSILLQFFTETAMLTAVSGGLGMAVAFGICGVVNQMEMPRFFAGLLPVPEITLLAMGLLGFIAIAAAMYPAARAASIDPIEALRWEAGG